MITDSGQHWNVAVGFLRKGTSVDETNNAKIS